MSNIKSERLKKLEAELQDLEKWLKLGLVPKKDIKKHETEIEALQMKVTDEKERLRFLKESGDTEEYSLPKRPPGGRQVYQEPQTLPGIESGMTDSGLDADTGGYESTTQGAATDDGATSETTISGTDEEDPFSDKNRWKRGILEDPESDAW